MSTIKLGLGYHRPLRRSDAFCEEALHGTSLRIWAMLSMRVPILFATSYHAMSEEASTRGTHETPGDPEKNPCQTTPRLPSRAFLLPMTNRSLQTPSPSF